MGVVRTYIEEKDVAWSPADERPRLFDDSHCRLEILSRDKTSVAVLCGEKCVSYGE
jgi:hypothetical protein